MKESICFGRNHLKREGFGQPFCLGGETMRLLARYLRGRVGFSGPDPQP